MRKSSFSKLIVAFVIIANVAFTAAVLYIYLKTEGEPVVLIGAWFSFTTVELWQLAQIKQKKTEKASMIEKGNLSCQTESTTINQTQDGEASSTQ